MNQESRRCCYEPVHGELIAGACSRTSPPFFFSPRSISRSPILFLNRLIGEKSDDRFCITPNLASVTGLGSEQEEGKAVRATQR